MPMYLKNEINHHGKKAFTGIKNEIITKRKNSIKVYK